MVRLLPLVALSALAAAQEDFAMVRLLPLVAVAALAAAQEDFGNMFGQQKYCAPYKCPKEKEAVQNRLSFKAKKGGCDALNSGAGMQMRGSASVTINKGPSSFFGGRRHVHASTP